MQRERWERLERLFAQGLTLPEAQRAAWLVRACDDAALRGEVEELLRTHTTDGVLDTPVLATGGADPAVFTPSLAADTHIGAWRIERLVGRGGMGEVYAALRAAAEFSQRGALKLLRFEAIGELARFHAERQILARLDHPGIARLLDGGVAPDGRPYTVMEFVDGTSLIDYCNARHASLAERLELFAQVCDAVAYAHRNLVIHRDLKSANTLVDADGKVKLLDFGIAKLLDDSASKDTADPTMTVAPFTPDYAAPEQLAGEPVTTATDVYALGVLLFELLTGERPLRMRGLPSAQALALLDTRAAPVPSRVARDNPNAPVPASALEGDLDAIVAKCLRREPAHRYDTVNGLKLDLQRHIDHEPVLAREGARLYVLGRVLRRYRWATAAAAALILALSAGLAGTLWQARKAETQARLAQAQLSRAEATKQFLLGVFKASDPRIASDKPRGGVTARELLDASASRIEKDFAAQPELQIELLGTAAEIFRHLDEPGSYAAFHGRYMDLMRQRYGELDSRFIDSDLMDADYAIDRDDLERAARVLDQVDSLITRAGLDHSLLRARWAAIKSVAIHWNIKNQAERQSLLLRAIDLYERIDPGQVHHILALTHLGNLYGPDLGDRARSGEYYLRAKAALARLPDRDDSLEAYVEAALGGNAGALGDLAGTDASFERSIKLYLQTNGEHEPWYWATLANWALAVCRHGDRERASRIFERVMPRLPATPGVTETYSVPRALEAYGTCLTMQGRAHEAIPLLESAERMFSKYTLDLRRVRQTLGDAYDQTRRSDDARRVLKLALDDQLELASLIGAPDNAKLLNARERWGRFLLAHGEPDEAERQFREIVAQDHGRNLESTALAHGGFTQLALLRGDAGAAVRASTEAQRIRSKVSGERSSRTEPYLWRIHAQALARTGDLAGARDYAQRAFDAFRRYDDPTSKEITESAAVLAKIDLLARK